MNYKKFETMLRENFQRKVMSIGGNNLYVCEGEVDLPAILKASAEVKDVEDYKYWLDDGSDEKEIINEGLADIDGKEFLENHHYKFDKIIEFYWLSFGPMSSYSYIGSIKMRDGSKYLYYLEEDDKNAYRLILRFEPKCSIPLLRAAIREIFNGTYFVFKSYINFLGSLPTLLVNNKPNIITTSIMRDIIYNYIEYKDKNKKFESWSQVYESLKLRILEPDHLNRSMIQLTSIISELESAGIDKIGSSNFGRKDGNFTYDEKQKILDLFFSIRYREQTKDKPIDPWVCLGLASEK